MWMRLLAVALLVVIAWQAKPWAQDIAGIEDCTKTSGLNQRTGCLQANVNYLQKSLTRQGLEAHRRMLGAEAEIASLKTALAALRKQVQELQSARASEDAKAAAKKADAKKSDNPKTDTKQ